MRLFRILFAPARPCLRPFSQLYRGTMTSGIMSAPRRSSRLATKLAGAGDDEAAAAKAAAEGAHRGVKEKTARARPAAAKRARAASAGEESTKRARGRAGAAGAGDRDTAEPRPESATGARPDQETFWLFKSEPETRMVNGIDVRFSIDDLAVCTDPEPWTGVRNYLARNNMREMKLGDLAFFYHSNTKVPGIVGVCRVAEEATVDQTAFDQTDPYYDPKSTDRSRPRWFCVKVKFVEKFPAPIPLASLQAEARKKGSPLREMAVATSRRAASVSKVTKGEWEWILREMVRP